MNTRKLTLLINGAERTVLCNPEKDTLADVVRRTGLTGTKVGCDAGQCGACTVLVDGQVTRSCIKKMKNVPEYSVIETVEGIGTAANLHPLQQAFITYAAIQCGFCTPGFLMSAKALLAENPNPTRQEVRDWFTRNRNLCRCTGYIPLVDAVMAAAAVMRGEKTMADITFAVPEDGRIYNTECPKPTGLAKVTGAAEYGADVALKMPEGSYHLAVVMGKQHHARIKKMDFSRAEKMPGFVRAITAKDVKGTNRITNVTGGVRFYSDCMERPVICEDKVFRYGDVVAVIAAHSREQARAAAAAVEVEYEPLTPYLSYIDAARADAEPIHEGRPNIYLEQPLFKGEETKAIIEGAKHVVSGSFYTTRQPHLPLEPDTAQAYPLEDGVAIHCKSQFLYGNRNALADGIGLPKEKVRIIQNAVGASFGYSMAPATYALVAVCALALDAPVSLVFDYAEHQHYTGKRSPTFTNMRMACGGDGKITAMEFLMGIDHGAYSDMAGALANKVVRFFGYPYSVPNIRGLSQVAYTNNNFGVAYRAFGSPQTYTATEQIMDMMAEELGMDPFEFRYINVARPGDLCPTATPYREYPMQSMMDMMRPYYEKAKMRADKESRPGKKRGVGICWGGYHVGKSTDKSEVDLELNEDGSVTNYNCWADMGQGSDVGALVHTHEALRPLGLRPDQIHLVMNDTGECPDTGSTSGSRSHNAAGHATLNAAEQLLNAMRKPDGAYRTYQEMRAEGIPTRYRGQWSIKDAGVDKNTGRGIGHAGQNYMLFMAEVEVDMDTGKTTVLTITSLADIGVVGTYQGVKGQAWGGIAHSVGYALSEDYDDVKKHASMLGAGVPQCNDIPDDIKLLFHVTPREIGPHGSTGCSEGYQSSGHVCILNAIADATGVRIFTLPATPEKVKAALEAKAGGKDAAQTPWDLGCDLHARLEYIRENPQ